MPKISGLRRHVVTVTLSLISASALDAQNVAPVLDVGASTVRYSDVVTVSATTVSPTLRIESSGATLTAAGTFSSVNAGGWTGQGGIAGSRFMPLGRGFHGELAGSAGGSAHHDETRTGQLLAQGRAHFIGNARGFWLGGGFGRTWDGVASHRITLADAGAWVSTGSAMILASVAPASISDAGQPNLRYADATTAARWVGPRAEVAASLGARFASALLTTGVGSSTWGSVSGALWVAGPVALAASAGTYPIDYTQGYPGGRFASVALRLARRPSSRATSGSADASLAVARDGPTPIGPIASFSVGPSADRKHRTISVRARAALSVEVTGDFTRWQPLRLTRQRDGRWVATLPLPAGTHEIALRIDGGAWLAPPGLTTIRDEFGGVTGLLAIKE
jgi:hypothetical protein